MPKGSLVLDAGSGNAPYKHLFRDMRYESADFKQVDKEYDDKITYVCDLKAIPVKDGRFDFIIFNQTLEHLPEPQAVLDELYRVLKPGGKILCTAPLFYEEHEQPYDFYRYTQFGWRVLVETAGFKIERIDWLEGFFGLCAYLFDMIYRNLPTAPQAIHSGIAGYVLAPFLFLLKYFLALNSVLFHHLEKHIKIVLTTGAKNYIVIATKPARSRKSKKNR